MIVIRFAMQSRSEMTEQLDSMFQDIVTASRGLDGVVSVDIGQDVVDPNRFIATSVFEDQEALHRQRSLPEVEAVMERLPSALTAPPDATVFEVASAQPYRE